jgi:hypothetical protein
VVLGLATFDDESRFLDSGHRAAAVLCRTEHGSLHAGVLHLDRKDEVQVLHLGWFDRLSTEWKWRRLWATPEAEPEHLRLVSGHCRRIWKRYRESGTFPYALAWCGSDFDGRGRLRLGPESKGLTCATLVLAVFKAAGVDLVDEADWPVRKEEDHRFIDGVAKWAEPDHVALLREEVERGVKRIHPHEVVGACAQPDLPVGFAIAAEVAGCVLHELDGAGPADAPSGPTVGGEGSAGEAEVPDGSSEPES